MIRVDPLFDTSRIENLADFMDAWPELATEVMEDAFANDIEPFLLDELQRYPGPSLNSLNSSQPFVWSIDPEANKRAAAYFFGNNLQGKDRTGALAEAYETDLVVGDGLVALAVRNRKRYWKWVKGPKQIPGHNRTGWDKDAPTMAYWAEATRDVLAGKLIDLVRNARF